MLARHQRASGTRGLFLPVHVLTSTPARPALVRGTQTVGMCLSSSDKNQTCSLLVAPLLLRLISGFSGLPTEVSAQPLSHDQLLQPSVGSAERDQ